MKITIDVTPAFIEAIENLAQAISGGTPQVASAGAPTKVAQEIPEETVPVAKPPTNSMPTFEEVRQAMIHTIEKTKDRQQVVTCLASLGADKLTDLPEEKYGDLLALLEAI